MMPMSIDVLATARSVAGETLGTTVDVDAPLMSAGLDSLAAASFVDTLSSQLSLDIASTALFDHPTLDSIASFLSTESGAVPSQAIAL